MEDSSDVYTILNVTKSSQSTMQKYTVETYRFYTVTKSSEFKPKK